MATAEDQQKKSEMNDQLREYISQWRDERSKEEAELKRLKDKQAARKEIHPMMIIILTWCSVSTWGRPLTSISFMLGVTLARVDIVSLKNSYLNLSNEKDLTPS